MNGNLRAVEAGGAAGAAGAGGARRFLHRAADEIVDLCRGQFSNSGDRYTFHRSYKSHLYTHRYRIICSTRTTFHYRKVYISTQKV